MKKEKSYDNQLNEWWRIKHSLSDSWKGLFDTRSKDPFFNNLEENKVHLIPRDENTLEIHQFEILNCFEGEEVFLVNATFSIKVSEKLVKGFVKNIKEPIYKRLFVLYMKENSWFQLIFPFEENYVSFE